MSDPPNNDIIYERRLDSDFPAALREGSAYFEGKSAVDAAAKKIAARLAELGIDYAVVGGMAVFRHGLRRFTEDIDILVTRDALATIHERLEGSGYRPLFQHSKGLRDTELGVRIEFLITGDYPGDGRPKPVAFPDPAGVSFEAGGIRYINLPTLLELKLASGMTRPERIQDLADVLRLIQLLNLPRDFAERLNPFVRDRFDALWVGGRTRYVRAVGDIPEDMLAAMIGEGVALEPSPSDNAPDFLVTYDQDIAARYDLHPEADYWADAPPNQES
jgi:hypothetical protein